MVHEDNMTDIKQFYTQKDIDPEFDYLFYMESYPDVLPFLLDYCLKHKIDDRHRMYFHWHLYGRTLGRFQNKKELINYHKPTLSIRGTKTTNNKLAVITPYFNPCGYKSKEKNYTKFASNVNQFADLFPVELSLDGNFFIEHKNAIRIEGNDRNILWQKEALLNIGLKELPKEYHNVAWVDCDVISNPLGLLEKIEHQLQQYKIIQLFLHVYHLQPNFTRNISTKNRCYCFPGGASGYAWAGRREILDEIKFLDNQVLGMADTIMANTFQNQDFPDYLKHQTDTYNWYHKAKNIVDGSYSYIDTEIDHLYHGQTHNRMYNNRYDSVLGGHNYQKYIVKQNDVWEWQEDAPQCAYNKIKSYFLDRDEDDGL